MKQNLPTTPGPIGVFDSGYGGLTILSKIREALPQYDYIYLNTTYPFEPDRYPITAQSLLPPLQRLLYAFTHDSVQQRYPLLAQLFCPATYSFLCLLCALLLLCRRQGRFALCLMPMAGLFISILFSAGVFVRYAYPLMACAPVLLTLSLARSAPEDVA